MDSTNVIEAIRLQTNFSVLALLSPEILSEPPHTEVISYSLSGATNVVYTPVRDASYAPQGERFPIIKTSMVATTALTVVLLNWMNPIYSGARSVPQSGVSGQASASSPATLAFIPSDPARYERAQRLHKAAMDARSEAAASAASASASSLLSTDSTSSESSVESSVTSPSTTISSEHSSSTSSVESSESSASSEVTNDIRIDNKQGVYLSASSVGRRKFLEETMQSIVDSGGSAIVFDVKGGAVLFHSAAPLANEIGLVKASYDLKEVIDLAKKHNLYTIGRFVAIKDHGITAKKPSTRVRHPKTGAVISQDWVDPSDETAIEYNAQVMCEIAASGIDEVNMDYIRFSTAQFGALRVYTGKEKADRVEKFIAAMREAINRCGSKTKLGISTFAILGWSYDINVETLGQDVIRFAPLVDVISPMAYPATFTSPEYYIPGKHPGPRMYYLVYRTLKGYADMLGPEQSKKIRPWIQGYSVVAKDMTDQIRAVYDAGFCGYQVWNAGNNYSQSYKAMKGDSLKPERCKEGQVVSQKL